MVQPAFILAQIYWREPQLWPLAALCAAAVLITIAFLYPAQLWQVPQPWRSLLPLLRIIAIVALLASILKPVAMRLANADERGAVVVLIDQSRSMGIVDNSRTIPQRVALADALGKLPPNVRNNAASALTAGLERLRTSASEVRGAQEDLDYARLSGRDLQSRQKRLDESINSYSRNVADLSAKAATLTGADEIKSKLADLSHPPQATSNDQWRGKVPQQIADAAKAVTEYQENADAELYKSNEDVRHGCDAVANLTRFDLVEQALLRPGGVIASTMKNSTIVGFGIGDGVTPIELVHGGHIVPALGARPDKLDSNLTAGIADAVRGRTVNAVVLFSDGRQVGGDPTIVSGLTPNRVPVFAVSAAAPQPPRDVSFASVQVPSSVFEGQAITVKAELRQAGFDGQTVDLHCKIGDKGAEQTRKLTLHNNGRSTAEFTAKLTDSGKQPVHFWFEELKDEASKENNDVYRSVKVIRNKIKVRLLAGSPTWDAQYVRNALRRLPEIELKDMILDPANPRAGLSAHEILSQDVILLFDVPIAAMNETQWGEVEKVAFDAGGSVIIVAGDAPLPTDYILSAAMMPFQLRYNPQWKVWPGDDPSFHFVPTPGTEGMELLRLPGEKPGGEPDVVPRRWEQLPGCFRFLQLPKPNDQYWNPKARALLVEEESGSPVLTEMQLGAGRVFFLGLTETWRWRMKVGERDQEHFWRQLIQHASDDPYYAHEGPLALDADNISPNAGEPIHVRARMIEKPNDGTESYVLKILRDQKVVGEQPLLRTDPNVGGRFSATLVLEAGEYDIEWSAAGEGKTVHTVKMPISVGASSKSSEAEMADLSGDRKMLRKLADASGGEFLTLEQVDRLPERLAAVSDARMRVAEFSLWDSPALFLLVVACLGLEWALRKRLGLA